MKKNLLKLVASYAVFFSLVSTGFSSDPASVLVWDGGGGNALTATAGNWNPDTTLTAGGVGVGSTYQFIFAGSTQTRPVWSAEYGITTIIYSNNTTAGSFQLNGNNQNVNLGSFFKRLSGGTASATAYFGDTGFNAIRLGQADVGSATTFTIDLRVDMSGSVQDGIGTSSRLIKEGSATLQLAGAANNTWTGGSDVNAGTLQLGKTASIVGLPAGVHNINNAAILRLNAQDQIAHSGVIINLNSSAQFLTARQNATAEAVQSTSTTTTIDLGAGATPGTLTIAPTASGAYNVASGVTEFRGTIRGVNAALNGGKFAKDGLGTLILSGNNVYSNSTTVLQGTLLVNGSLGYTPVTVSGGTLGGTGSIAGDTIVQNGATLAPGASPGTLAFGGNLNLSDLTVLAYDLAGTDTTVGGGINDLVTVGGTLTLDGVLNVTEIVAGGFLSASAGDEWRLFNYTVGLVDNALTLGAMPTLSGGLSFSIDTATVGQVNLVVVPEPSTWVLGLLGGLGLLTVFRRRHSA